MRKILIFIEFLRFCIAFGVRALPMPGVFDHGSDIELSFPLKYLLRFSCVCIAGGYVARTARRYFIGNRCVVNLSEGVNEL